MKVEGDWLTAAPTQAVMRMLEDGGHAALAVGGCVRNALLGAKVSDIDIATDARPERVIALARAAGLKPVPTGIEHGTITVVAQGVPHEVTTFRRDVETDGRHATVAFTDRVAEDAGRRDFTMNALYAARDGAVVDPLGGLPDLRARHVRFIRDPAARIREDYLRILRFFRFTAWYGDPARGVDAEGLAACAAHADGLARLSAERVGHEMRKLLAAPDPAPVVAAMEGAGVLDRVLPGAAPAGFADAVAIGPRDWIWRAAFLGGDVQGWRLSKAETRDLSDLSDAARGEDAAFALGDALGTRGEYAVLLRAALVGQPPEPDALALAERGAAEPFPLAAADLMPEIRGPALGKALVEARAIWRASDGRMDKEQLIAALRD